MSKLLEFRQAEKQLEAQLAALEAMKGDSALQLEIEFEQKLRDLLAQYGCSLRDVIAILDPAASTLRASTGKASTEKPTRRARQVKVYSNPHTGEIIETKGGNHKQLKEWKTQYGGDTVESWVKS
ncbi:histone-like nucleoid-structuring protein, MvaT/MvaU family [Pseudomonas syringae]|uniref:histone-like nucleoid-structuring protein, MvaT/MvaU family n=1 Tax=Pseudomonas syringae TaxID=317 RepID=UPI001F24FCFD|nr:histone-like nucleoid-structuring protein, MvaT/MvaU family [Pseudomonas syringae]MCF5372001.1 transcriptional regulator [Pseudomonas syringae]MCF5382002.1 transcriptional regulator [Pseudomonas syringae]MCF5419465.1 transcriptional regulator [Pseudomonas syringae]MCF5452011.1 transcriptional regulator [Pseudomonas syringae]MCF5456298.1 transcriptional regulator [Pseudomonas syringae]